MQPPSVRFVTFAGAALLGLASVAVAHSHDEDMNMDMGDPATSRPTITAAANVAAPSTYFRYGEHSGLMMAHIFLMTIAWVFVLPIGRQLPKTLKIIKY
jgi:Domain of unknown function (DUF2427)